MTRAPRRLPTTVLAVVGDQAPACLRAFADAANVAVVAVPVESGASAEDPLARAVAAWRRTVRSSSRFTMHDADPLQTVGDAWAGAFEGAPRGLLETAVADVVARWRADSVDLPDYYLVLDPDDLPAARKHWYLGILHRAAPHRVIPTPADFASARAAVARLQPGRWWPDLPDLLATLAHELPDRVMVSDTPGSR